MLLLLLIYVVLMALWKIDVYLINTLVDNKSLFKLRFFLTRTNALQNGWYMCIQWTRVLYSVVKT